MTATSQHGLHLDAESLSAFSEQALSARERADVLAHLAVCGRCRQVVALAREAATASAATAAAPARKAIAPNAWWRQWRFVWVPAGVAVAFAVTTFSFVIERADRHDAEFKITAQNPAQSTPPSASSSPTEEAKVEPPTAAAPAPSTPHAAKHEHSAAAEPMPASAPPAVTTQMPPEPGASAPEPMDRVAVMPEAHPTFHAEAQPAPPEFAAGGMRPAYAQPDTGARQASQEQAEQQRQFEGETSRRRFLKSKAAPAVVRGANAAPPADATQTDTVAAAPPTGTQPAALAEPALMPGVEPSPDVSTSAKPMRLPSGRAAVSIASGAQVLLAIDKAGALFLSEDQGATWERIAKQWKGRAVTVQQQARVHGALHEAPSDQNGTTGNPSVDASSGTSVTVFFELSNDKNQTWVSTDGRIWTPR